VNLGEDTGVDSPTTSDVQTDTTSKPDVSDATTQSDVCEGIDAGCGSNGQCCSNNCAAGFCQQSLAD
jgi:hypothetical protein